MQYYKIMNTYEFVGKRIVGFLILSGLSLAGLANDRPNILLAIGDDISWQGIGTYGAEYVNTPTFDRLAVEGVLFNNAYCSAPGCSPSRAALLRE